VRSFESRARRLAGRVDHERLIAAADRLDAKGAKAAALYRRAIDIQLENRALESSVALSDVLGDQVYDARPHGRLPSDGMGIER
jgi:hypothetical protein